LQIKPLPAFNYKYDTLLLGSKKAFLTLYFQTHIILLEIFHCRGRNMKNIIIILFAILFHATVAYGGAEYVTVVKILGNDDKGIIERLNGERWLIEKGVGALSFWRFEGKKVIIYSPGIFCGVGSKVILPELDQEARIWNAEKIEGSSSSNSSPESSDSEIAILALILLGYYDATSTEKSKSDVVIALKTFQEQTDLPQTGKISSDVQIALAKAVAAKKPQTMESLDLASSLLTSGLRLKSDITSPSTGKETFIVSVSSDCSIVKLGDGSIYEVDVIGQIKTMLWLPAQKVLRQKDGLLHLGKGQKVQATLLK